MKTADKVLKVFRVTEKTNTLASELGQYTFEVFSDANRTEVKQAVENHYKVKVTRVNILRQQGKRKMDRSRRGRFGNKASLKKAIVTLKAGDSIDIN